MKELKLDNIENIKGTDCNHFTYNFLRQEGHYLKTKKIVKLSCSYSGCDTCTSKCRYYNSLIKNENKTNINKKGISNEKSLLH